MQRIEKTILLPVLVVFLAVMAVVGISFFMSLNSAQKDVDAVATEYGDSTRNVVRDRLNIFEETLHAGLGLFAGNQAVTKDQFNQFINTSAVLERYPGAQSVAYVRVVSHDQLGVFQDSLRASLNPTFTVYPEGTRDVYAPVVFVEPQSDSNKKIIGFDAYSESVRQKALIKARDSGKVTITEVIQSPLDDSSEGRAFVMYAPQYKTGMPISTTEERQAAIEGYLYAGFRISRFMESVLPAESDDNGRSSFKISIGGEDQEFYKAANYDSITSGGHVAKTSELNVGNSTLKFTVVRQSISPFSGGDSQPLAILIFGLVAAILISGAVWLILRGKANELLLEQERGINEAKDNLLSLASHQLRTPATGVKQYLGMILQGFVGDVDQRQRQLLEKAYASNERQLKTINDVLYLARLGSGRIILSRSVFSVEQIVRDIVRELDNETNEKQHRLVVKIPKRQKDFYGDAHMIRMAIENLVTNAIKYTRDGGKIWIHVQHTKDALRISVRDNGIGIDKSQQDRLFEQFERIDNDLSIAVGGSGIGLYVVRNIAGMHDGHVEVESELESGSTFTIVLPYASPE